MGDLLSDLKIRLHHVRDKSSKITAFVDLSAMDFQWD